MNNKEKLEVFFEVAGKINKEFNVLPILYGSLGLSQAIKTEMETNDIDIKIPENVRVSRWTDLQKMMGDIGFELTNDEGGEFMRNDCMVSIARDELMWYAEIDSAKLEIVKNDKCEYKVVSPKQYLRIYQRSLKDNYRREKNNSKDLERIALIEKYLKENEEK